MQSFTNGIDIGNQCFLNNPPPNPFFYAPWGYPADTICRQGEKAARNLLGPSTSTSSSASTYIPIDFDIDFRIHFDIEFHIHRPRHQRPHRHRHRLRSCFCSLSLTTPVSQKSVSCNLGAVTKSSAQFASNDNRARRRSKQSRARRRKLVCRARRRKAGPESVFQDELERVLLRPLLLRSSEATARLRT